MKGYRTLLIAVGGLIATTLAAVAASPELVELIKSVSPWLWPVLMVLLRVITTGPVGRKGD